MDWQLDANSINISEINWIESWQEHTRSRAENFSFIHLFIYLFIYNKLLNLFFKFKYRKFSDNLNLEQCELNCRHNSK